MKFAICSEIFQGWPLPRIFSYAAELGYGAVEIAPFTISDSVVNISPEERRTIRTEAARANIAIAGIHWVLVKPEGLYINHPDVAIRGRTAAYFCHLVDFCADLGGKIMVVGSPKQRNLLPGVSMEQGWNWARETFRFAVQRAAERGVTICFEPLAPAETNFINTAAEAIKFVAELDLPNFKIILDVKAMCSEKLSIPEIIRHSAPHFAHFHANDENLKGPGFGKVQFAPIAQALKEVNYSGFVSVEVFDFAEGPEIIATQSIEYLRQAFGSAWSPPSPECEGQ
jgi:sugar phosphate isomerase/epimerase